MADNPYTKINWHDPSIELPADKCNVAVMTYYYKNCWPMSAEIHFGEVESHVDENGKRVVLAMNNDFLGGGSERWYFGDEHEYNSHYQDKIIAWAFASEFKRPEFIPHDPHWGEEHI